MLATTIDIGNLQTIKNYALKAGVTASYIYKLIKEKKIEAIDIDGVKFINIKKYPTIRNAS